MDKVKLIEICNPKQWKTLATSELKDNGKYLVYGANGVIGYYDNYNHEKETILITCRGATCGNIHISKEKSYINGNAMALDNLDEKVCLKEYLYYFLKQYDMKKVISGSAQPQITVQNLKNVEIKLKDIETQEKIVKKLDKVQEIIDIRKKQLEGLDELIKSQFVKIFGNINHNDKNWQIKKLKDNVTLLNGRAYHQNELLNIGKYPILRVGNFFSNRNWYYSDLELDDDKYCENGDLLYAWSASFGSRIWKGEKVIYHYHIWKVIHNENYNKLFLNYLLNMKTEELMQQTHGITMMHLTKCGMEETEFIVPPIELQEEFAEFVKLIDKQKNELQKSLEQIRKFQESLMNKYFGG